MRNRLVMRLVLQQYYSKSDRIVISRVTRMLSSKSKHRRAHQHKHVLLHSE